MTFSSPKVGEPTPAATPSDEALTLLRRRRSTSPELLSGRGPSAEEVAIILEIGARVPDHRRLAPFRFLVFEGEGRTRMGALLADALRSSEPSANPERLEQERRRFERAPLVVGVVSVVDRAHKTPEWEQILTAGAVCQNLLLAANALGYAGCWITEWCAYDETVRRGLKLQINERIAGFIYFGAARQDPLERPRPTLASLITRF